jgi:hypothetical protein
VTDANDKTRGDKMKISKQDAELVAMAIIQNEKLWDEGLGNLSDSQIGMYLVDRGIEESEENVKAVRKCHN